MTDASSQMRFREQEEEATQQRANMLGLLYVDSRNLNDMPLLKGILSVREMYDWKIVPMRDLGEGSLLTFGITIQTSQQVLRELRERFIGRNVEYVMISNLGYKELMRRFDPPKEVHYDDVTIATEGDSATLAEVSKTLDQVRSEDIVNYLIQQAIRLHASDIHLECNRHDVRIRFRVDGALHQIASIGKEKYRMLQSSIASRANISIDAPDAQTGHISEVVQGPDGGEETLNMRIETVPTVYGQDAVLRLFEIDETMMDLDKLRFSKQERQNIDDVIAHPHGLVLVVGPTGSGKSTTLYSILNALNTTQRKIITLEDPVEYAIDGVSQIPVASRKGESFAEKLRAVMRLDPDVIMVGEIRDVDTARTAIQASITGHLVLSTFHATDAPAALSRMIDMIGPNPIFASAIKMIIAQRLVRRLDDKLKQSYTPDERTVEYIKNALKDLPKNAQQPDYTKLTLYKPGKSEENPFGYAGRMMILEQLLVDEAIQGLIRQDVQHIDSTVIQKTAIAQGMMTIQQDGILKALQGLTTLEEINRVI
ncbi:MAG TPA: GspE/PulE family protein [Candidatus Saccharimonadales bacterium]|nr:GspE/PulE family protein [Candidatus Saccharimonadales bacterium]